MIEMSSYIGAVFGTAFTFLMTVLGAAVVFCFKDNIRESFQKIFLGFAAGVMIAASIWSLLLPALEAAEEMNIPPFIPAGGGFVLGGLFLGLIDRMVRRFRPKKLSHGSFLLFSAITMHNIPEGMAVGLAFSVIGAGQSNMIAYASAIGLALGIGIQNFPEGAAISLPLRKEGMSKKKAFYYGSMTGAVEPLFGILVTLIAGAVRPLMPWLLSFAAGAMIYVVADELIPQAKDNCGRGSGTFGVMIGFLIMMVLDVAFG